MADSPAILNQLTQANYLSREDTPQAFAHHKGKYGFAGRSSPGVDYQFNKQVHGTVVVEADSIRENGILEADGIWTQKTGLNIAVRTADCLPVLLADRGKTMVMAVHAGWRGLTSGILSRAIDIFDGNRVALADLTVAIGPAISRQHYEVGPEVVEALFEGAIGLPAPEACLCIAKGKHDRWFLDLQTAALISLIRYGVAPRNVDVIQTCTFSAESYYSYRMEGKGVGSNISWIGL